MHSTLSPLNVAAIFPSPDRNAECETPEAQEFILECSIIIFFFYTGIRMYEENVRYTLVQNR